jgi:hypothetical protein
MKKFLPKPEALLGERKINSNLTAGCRPYVKMRIAALSSFVLAFWVLIG